MLDDMSRSVISSLVQAVARRGGVVRTRVLIADGYSKHHQMKAVSSGTLLRVGRSWLAVPNADAELVAAARCGVVLTCITEARRREIWVLDDAVAHVAAPAHGHVRAGTMHVHWADPVVPRDPEALADPIENVLAVVAECRPHDEALAVWESAIRQGKATIEALRRLPLGPSARALCDEAIPWSDSGLESFVSPRLRFLRLPIVPQAWIGGHRVDFLIGDRLVLQVDGGSHVGAQREQDIAHDAALMLMGYHVIRVGYTQVVQRWHEVQALVMRAVSQGLHRA
jgi:very-short-patch-repair endonuclease